MGSTRESRAAESIKMKDEQLRILTEQNSHLLCRWTLRRRGQYDAVGEACRGEENRKLRDQNFELQSKARAADAAMRRRRRRWRTRISS